MAARVLRVLPRPVISTFLFSVFFGFLSASIVHPVFHRLLRFRAEWHGTFVACMMTSLVCGLTFATASASYDRKSGFYSLIVFGTTLAIAFVAGAIAFRLIIRSESGRSLNLLSSAIVSGLMALPPAVLMIGLYVFDDRR